MKRLRLVLLVPTRVGMILQMRGSFILMNACPHTRGDDPQAVYDFEK